MAASAPAPPAGQVPFRLETGRVDGILPASLTAYDETIEQCLTARNTHGVSPMAYRSTLDKTDKDFHARVVATYAIEFHYHGFYTKDSWRSQLGSVGYSLRSVAGILNSCQPYLMADRYLRWLENNLELTPQYHHASPNTYPTLRKLLEALLIKGDHLNSQEWRDQKKILDDQFKADKRKMTLSAYAQDDLAGLVRMVGKAWLKNQREIADNKIYEAYEVYVKAQEEKKDVEKKAIAEFAPLCDYKMWKEAQMEDRCLALYRTDNGLAPDKVITTDKIEEIVKKYKPLVKENFLREKLAQPGARERIREIGMKIIGGRFLDAIPDIRRRKAIARDLKNNHFRSAETVPERREEESVTGITADDTAEDREADSSGGEDEGEAGDGDGAVVESQPQADGDGQAATSSRAVSSRAKASTSLSRKRDLLSPKKRRLRKRRKSQQQ